MPQLHHDPEEILYTPERSSARLYDYLSVFWNRKFFLLGFIIIGIGLAVAYTFFLPETYVAAAALMPPESSAGKRGDFTTMIQSGMGIDIGGLSGGGGTGQIFSEILTSRTLADSLINRLDLIERMKLPGNRQLAVDLVRTGMSVEIRKSGVIGVSYAVTTGRFPTTNQQNEARELAAEIVNESVDLLDVLNQQKTVTQARSSREFLDKMIALKRTEMDRARQDLADFQKNNNAIALDKQVEVSVSRLADIQSQIQLMELRISAAQQELMPDAQEVTALQNQLAQLKQQRARVSGTDLYGMDMSNAPELAMEFAKLKLDLEVATSVYAYLESQNQSERLNEARDLPTVSVLDEAQPPVFRSAPRRTFFVMIASIVIIVAALVMVILLELFGKDFGRFFRDRLPERFAHRRVLPAGSKRKGTGEGGRD